MDVYSPPRLSLVQVKRDGPTMSVHALERRLEAYGAMRQDMLNAIYDGREAAFRVMELEFAQAELLSTESRLHISHPGRVRTAADGQHYWINGLVYVVENDKVVTVIDLNMRQLDSMELVEEMTCPYTTQPLTTLAGFMQEVRRIADEMPLVSGRRPTLQFERHDDPPKPTLKNHDELPFPRWFSRPRASWDILVVQPHGNQRGAADEMARRMLGWMRNELRGALPKLIRFDHSAEAASLLSARLSSHRRARCEYLPDVPECAADYPENRHISVKHAKGKIPMPLVRWWNCILATEPMPTAGRLFTVVTPRTAVEMLKIASGSRLAMWHTLQHGAQESEHTQIAVPGRVLRVTPTSIEQPIKLRFEQFEY